MSKKDPHKTALLKESTFELLEECKEEFKKHNKELQDVHISNDHIIRRIAKYYLDIL